MLYIILPWLLFLELQHLHAPQNVWDTLYVLVELLVEYRVGSPLHIIKIPGEGVMRGS